MRWSLRDRRAALIAALYFVTLLIAAATSTPRRVGDGGEYVVMAMQFAAGRAPALSADQLVSMKGQLQALGTGFESALLDYPDLIGADGRQDFLHFFLYPLLVAPAMPLVDILGFHPNWAFTLVNALLLAGAVFVVGRSAPLMVVVAGFVSPIIWWVDKAHTEAFLFALVSVAAVMFRDRPAVALIAFALAGAQNAALGVSYPFFAAVLFLATRRDTFTGRAWTALAAGALIVFSPFLYTWARLGRWSPMAEYAQRVIPSVNGLASFVIEPNIGLLPSAPAYGVIILSAAWLLIQAIRYRSPLPPVWWWPAVIHVLLLVVWSQNPNANHGGTPGVNRWVLSLLAIGLPWLALARQQMPQGARLAMNVLVAVPAVLSAAAHWPTEPESYRAPTTLAQRLWDRGWMHVTPAEVFAERTQGREPAFAPGHDGRCQVLLIADQRAPVQCAPPVDTLPTWCRGPGAMCYAVTADDATSYVRAPVNGFFYQVADPSWPASGPLATSIRKLLREVNPHVQTWRVDNSRRWRERLTGADVGVVLSTPEAVVIYILRLTEDARARIAADSELAITPLLDSPLSNLAVVIRR